MRLMRLTIRTKIILTVSVSLVAIFALIMFLLVRQQTSQLRSELNGETKSFAALATQPVGDTFVLYQDSGRLRITQQVNKFLALDPDVTSIEVVSVDGQPLYNSGSNSAGSSVSPSQAGSFKPEYVTASAGYIKRVIQPYFEASGAHRYSVVYEISTQRVKQNVTNVVRLILYVGVVILAVSIASTLWLLNSLFIRPLRAVSHSANLISSGDLNRQIVAGSHDEIGDLAGAVNKMADSLKADIVKLQEVDKLKSEFLMIASHNLRTPLTVMRGYMDLAGTANTVEALKKIIIKIQDSVTRLNLLSEDLLTISTLEAGTETMPKEPVGVAHFLETTVAEFKLLAEQKGVRWNFVSDVPAETKLPLNQASMRSALGNIIDNAIKFTKEGGAVEVRASQADGKLVFTVADNGIGISPEEQSKLFTKFHRGTSTLNYDYEGVGIGLYLTKLIVERHGGRIGVRSTPGRGSTFSVYLPLAPLEPAAHPPAA